MKRDQNMGNTGGLGDEGGGRIGRAHIPCSQRPPLMIPPPTSSLPVLSALAAAHPLCAHRPPGQESDATLVLASGGVARPGHSRLASPVLVACPHGVDCSHAMALCDRLESHASACVLWQVYFLLLLAW